MESAFFLLSLAVVVSMITELRLATLIDVFSISLLALNSEAFLALGDLLRYAADPTANSELLLKLG